MAKEKLSLSQTERRLPEIARSATGAAYRRALRAGSVLVYRNGELRQVASGGKTRVVKKMAPRQRVAKGSKFEIKPAQT